MDASRYIWADFLRIIAIFAVIIQHYCPAYYESYPIETNIMVTLCDWCVPVFVMLSGMFSISPEKSFDLKKRFGHLLIALCFWSIAYGINCYVIQDHSPYTILSIIQPIFWKRLPWYHLWFIYMILGLYLLTPIIRTWVASASKRNILFFLILCFTFNSITWVNQFLPYPLHHLLPTISVFVGYYVLGYLLSIVTIAKRYRVIIYCASVAAYIGVVLTNQFFNINAHTLIVNENPLTAIMSIGIFIAVKNARFAPKWSEISKISCLVFGIYLVHDFIIQYIHISLLSCFISVNIIINALSNLLLSALIVYVIKKIPLVGKYIV